MYPVKYDEKTTAKACTRGARISWKDAREIGRFISGKKLSFAKAYLADVVEKKKPIPFGRFNWNLAHRSGMGPAAYPFNATKKMIELLESAEKNAEYKGLDVEKLFVRNVWATKGALYQTSKRADLRGMKLKNTNVSIVVEERETKKAKGAVPKKDESKAKQPKKEAKKE